jgi:hypothetical protein
MRKASACGPFVLGGRSARMLVPETGEPADREISIRVAFERDADVSPAMRTSQDLNLRFESGRQDLNLRPPGPQSEGSGLSGGAIWCPRAVLTGLSQSPLPSNWSPNGPRDPRAHRRASLHGVTRPSGYFRAARQCARGSSAIPTTRSCSSCRERSRGRRPGEARAPRCRDRGRRGADRRCRRRAQPRSGRPTACGAYG